MHPVRRGVLAALPLALLAAACDSPTVIRDQFQPPPLTGTFELVAVDGQPIPTTITIRFGGGVSFAVDSGELDFQAPRLVAMTTSGDLSGNSDVRLGFQETYTQPRTDSIVVGFQGAGRLWRDTLELRTSDISPLGVHTLRYVRAAATP